MLNIRALNQQSEWVNPVRFWKNKLEILFIERPAHHCCTGRF